VGLRESVHFTQIQPPPPAGLAKQVRDHWIAIVVIHAHTSVPGPERLGAHDRNGDTTPSPVRRRSVRADMTRAQLRNADR
jgi:hypothetical protein